MSKKRLAKGKRTELRRLKADIRKSSATKEEAEQKIRDLVSKTYSNK